MFRVSEFLYPATQKVAGYYFIPSELWVFIHLSDCPSALRFRALTSQLFMLVPFDLFSSNFAETLVSGMSGMGLQVG